MIGGAQMQQQATQQQSVDKVGARLGDAGGRSRDGANCAMREKYWHELTDPEKIERMHAVVKAMMHANEQLRAELSSMRDHQHGPGGDVLVPARMHPPGYGQGRISGEVRREGEYF